MDYFFFSLIVYRRRTVCDPSRPLTDDEAIFILNAERESKSRLNVVVNLIPKELGGAAKSLENANNLRKQARTLFAKWETDYREIRLGSSSFLLRESSVSMTEKLGLLSNAKQAQKVHLHYCPDNCTYEKHSSTGGLETVSDDTAAQQLRHEICNYENNCYESFIPDDPDDDPAEPFDDYCNSVEKEQTRQQQEDELLEKIDRVLQAMAKDNSLEGITFKRILQHWAVKWGIVQDAIEDFIRLLQLVNPRADFSQLPKSGKTLFKVAPDAVVDKLVTITEIKSPSVNDKPEKTGEYMHLGVENAVRGISIGILHVSEHRQLFRLISYLFPKLLPKELVESAMSSGSNSDVSSTSTPMMVPSDISQAATPANDNNRSTDPTIIKIDVNIDGVVWFQSAASEKVVPILGKFHSISRGSFTLKMPSIQKPFIIGVFRGQGKCSVQKLCHEFIKEMIKLGDTSRSRLPFIVEISSFICDAPMRAELKGIVNFNGYYGCERCKTPGEMITPGGKTKGSIKFPETDAAPRLDDEWEDYTKDRLVPDKTKKVSIYNIYRHQHCNNFEHEIIGTK